MTTLKIFLTGIENPLYFTLSTSDAETVLTMFRSQHYATLLINGDVLATSHIAAILVRNQEEDPS